MTFGCHKGNSVKNNKKLIKLTSKLILIINVEFDSNN